MVAQISELRFQVGGTVNPRSGLYITRPTDDELLNLLKRGEYANVLCSRQTGKSSLLLQTKMKLLELGYAAASIDVAGYLGTMGDADDWYQGLLDEIAHQVGLDINVEEWWEKSRAITANQRLIRFFRDEIAAKTSVPVVIFLDEIDSTIALPYTDDFFVAIRAMYNDRATEPLFERITFCLVGVATPNELIKNRRTTPYNVGRTIDLSDFDPDRDDMRPLFKAVSDDPVKGEAIVRAVVRWTGGHPYLTLRLCDQFVAQRRTSPDGVDEMVNKAFVSLDQLHSDVHFQQVLRFLGERIENKLSTLTLYRRVLSGEPVRDQTTPAHIDLKLAGIVKRDDRGQLAVRNPIYARVFTDEWVAKTLLLRGQYRMEAVIEKTNMSAVYKATHLGLGRIVAIKEYWFMDEYLRNQLMREARALAGLEHPQLPRLFDYFEEGDSQFMVMEYIPGKDLREMLHEREDRNKGPFEPDLVLQWADQLLNLLQYLHTLPRPIIHQGIKPQNLKLMPGGKVMLLDPGLTKGSVTLVGNSSGVHSYALTYAPLEQIKGEKTNARSDLYSLGTTLYHLMTGSAPPDAVERVNAMGSGYNPLRPAHELNTRVLPAVSAVLDKAMALYPGERPASAAEMRQMLRQARFGGP